jgi:quercetin dioxygenase-like cupin family protein
MMAVVWIAGAVAAGCADEAPPTATASAHANPGALVSAANHNNTPPPPILIEPLTLRHEFTDDVAAQIRLKPEGRPRTVVNLHDASKIAVLRFTVQPGVRFPWHTHPGLVLVTVTQGELVYVYADDCVRRPYPADTAFVDPGNNVHFAFNPSAGETILVATFLGIPATGPLTIPVAAATAAELDAKCGIAPAS